MDDLPLPPGPLPPALVHQALAIALAEGTLGARHLDRLWHGRVPLDARKALLDWFRAAGVLQASDEPRTALRCACSSLPTAQALLAATPWSASSETDAAVVADAQVRCEVA